MYKHKIWLNSVLSLFLITPLLHAQNDDSFSKSAGDGLGNGYDLRVRGTYTNEADFDSITIEFGYPASDPVYTVLYSGALQGAINIDHDLSNLDVAPDTIVDARMRYSKYLSGVVTQSYDDVKLYDMQEPVRFYQSTFTEQSDFARHGFNHTTSRLIQNKALHSWHPYSADTYIETIFQKPIIISKGGTQVSFKEILQLRQSDDGSGGEGHIEINGDFALIYASNDFGENWKVLNRYNTYLHQEWSDSNGLEPDRSLYKLQEIPLSAIYETGDTVILKFAIESDGTLHDSWGWVIDDFTIEPVVSNDELPEYLSRVQLAPNPTDAESIMIFEPESDEYVQCSLHDILGQRIQILYTGEVYAHEPHQVQVSLADQSQGTYIVRISNGTQSAARLLVKH